MTDTYRTLGTGAHTVLCLHGWFGSSTGWGEDFCAVLDTDTFRYVFMNYRGYGERADVAGDLTLEEIAQDALALADELGADRFSVVGHSMGGGAAQRVLSLAPDRVDRLVGISPTPASGVPFDDDGWGLFSGAAQEDGNRAAIIDFTTGNRLSQRWIDAMVRHSVERSTREAFGAYLELVGQGRLLRGGLRQPGARAGGGRRARPGARGGHDQRHLDADLPQRPARGDGRTPATTPCSRRRWRWPPWWNASSPSERGARRGVRRPRPGLPAGHADGA